MTLSGKSLKSLKVRCRPSKGNRCKVRDNIVISSSEARGDHAGVQEVVAINRGSFAMWTAREDPNLADGVKMALFFNDQQRKMRIDREGAKKTENVAKNNRSSRY